MLLTEACLLREPEATLECLGHVRENSKLGKQWHIILTPPRRASYQEECIHCL